MGRKDGSEQPRRCRRARLGVLAVAVAGLEALPIWRRGYGLGGNVIVRCRRGHLFTTIWIPGGSVKSLRLGWWRLQRCPVGSHWSLVTPARASDLTEEERDQAALHHDIRVP